jgi:hypothetical protein
MQSSSSDSFLVVVTVGVALFAGAMWFNATQRRRFGARLALITDVAVYIAPLNAGQIEKYDALLRVAATRGWNVVGVYTDAALVSRWFVTGSCFGDLLADSKRFNLVLVSDASCFRDLWYVMDRLYYHKVGLFSLDGSFDCSTEEGREAYVRLMGELAPSV